MLDQYPAFCLYSRSCHSARARHARARRGGMAATVVGITRAIVVAIARVRVNFSKGLNKLRVTCAGKQWSSTEGHGV